MKFSHFFIDRPVFAAVLSIVICIAGALSIFNLPIAQYPEIAPPTVTVNAVYPGANAKVVADTVATPLEEQINGVENMLYMSSQSTNDGKYQLTVTFELGTDLDIAQVQVQNRAAVAEPLLPEEVRRLGLTVRKASPDLTLAVNLHSPGNKFDTLYMSNYATLHVRDELARLPGVGDVFIFGARDYAMRLWLDPQKMAARSLTAGDVVAAVREQNVQVAAGIVGGPPLPAGTAEFQYAVHAEGRLTDPDQFAQIVVKTGENGQLTRLRDIGRVELGAVDYSTSVLFNGEPAIGIPIFQLPGSNALETADAVYATMEKLKKDFPPGLDYAIPYDTTIFVRSSIHDVIKTLFEAVGLVVIVVLVFLQTWRASVIPLIAIPVSLIGTFAVMHVAGFSINNLTLFGMVLAIGIVVDDAIVVVENVQRWIEQGATPRDAAYRSMEEVTGAVIAIAFGLSAVFIPVAFVSGITGQFYRQFALTIAFSTLLSALNSLTLSPALAALLLRPHDAKPDWLSRMFDAVLGWFFRLFNRALERTTHGYVGSLHRVLRLWVVALIVYAGLITLAYFGFKTVPRGFIPPQDAGYLIAGVQLPDAATIDRTVPVMERLAKIAQDTPGVEYTFAVPGFSILSRTNQTNTGTMFIALDPFEKRAGHDNLTADAIMQRLRGAYSQVQEAMAMVLAPPPVRGVGNAGGFKMQVEDRAGTASPEQLAAATQQLIAAARQEPTLTSLFTTFRPSVPQLYADIDREKVKSQGVQVTDVFDALQVFLGGLYVNDFNFLGRTYRVTAQAEAPFRATADEVAQLKTRNRFGRMVPLGAVMDLEDITGPDRINRYNMRVSAEINGSAAEGSSSGDAMDLMEKLARQHLPRGFGFEWTELAYQEKLAGNTAILVFPLCVLFVWLVHSAEYESFALSTAIILIVPMCLLCGIAGVWLRGMDNNIFTQIGFLVLAGLSAKNAVLIVEFAKQQQEEGKDAVAAALEAARLRLRPILMTSFAFILGVVPLLLATGAGAEMRQALGTVVFFGMIGVTFFGLFLTPVFYEVIRRVTGKTQALGHEADRERNEEIPWA
ncbi:MAG TPA: multidrug efflux RND transporter permease subunit [Phycisphaerae bacterium]|nr:multidrug efflux RND transporter permease subunit [Phycisphaerales bacterium]HRX83538.1 multidrug efflux RND transporter permease subunit [Phycisphaerae bacterium]